MPPFFVEPTMSKFADFLAKFHHKAEPAIIAAAPEVIAAIKAADPKLAPLLDTAAVAIVAIKAKADK